MDAKNDVFITFQVGPDGVDTYIVRIPVLGDDDPFEIAKQAAAACAEFSGESIRDHYRREADLIRGC